MNTLVKIFGLLALVAVCFGEELVDCSNKFTKPTEDKGHKDIIMECTKEVRSAPESEKPLTEEDFIASNYDDKCVAKCTLEKMKLMAGGKLDRAAILKDAESMLLDKEDKSFKTKIDALTNKCLDEAAKMKPECAVASYFGFCVGKAQDKICLPPPTPKE